MLFNPELGGLGGVRAFPKGICPKVIIIEPRDFELAYNDSGVQRFNHYTTGTPPMNIWDCANK